MIKILFEMKVLKEHYFKILYFNHNLYDRLHSEILYLCDKMNSLNMNNEIEVINKEYNDIMFDYKNVHCYNGMFITEFKSGYVIDGYLSSCICKFAKDFDEIMENF